MHVDPTAPLGRRLFGSFTAKINEEMWRIDLKWCYKHEIHTWGCSWG